MKETLDEQSRVHNRVSAVHSQKKHYEVKTVSPDIEKWSGCATFTQEEIESDPRLKAILSR
jgi:hypothetical protein